MYKYPHNVLLGTAFEFTYGKTSRKKLLESIILSTTNVVSHRLFRYNDYKWIIKIYIGINYLCYIYNVIRHLNKFTAFAKKKH